ncbi:uncharacterized protein MCAP_0864-like [Chironomus tepperi]|uniref:uncharacterized protein MCAP_0864-like n=1 Tax=Chironomus tepperi TaxID=113505 RepID=UPI00391F4AF7
MTLFWKLLFLLLLITSCSQAEEIAVDCDYGYQKFLFCGNISSCNIVKNLEIFKENVTIVIGNVKGYETTRAFTVRNQQIRYLPKGIVSTFKYLQALEIINSSLTKITADNLNEFRNLRHLGLSHNNIKYLESDLFRYNYYIKTVDLNNNRISTIEPTFAKTKAHLTVLTLEKNVCYSGSARSQPDLDNMIEVLKIECSATAYALNMNLQELRKSTWELTAEGDRLTAIETSLINLTEKFDSIQRNSTNQHKLSLNQVNTSINELRNDVQQLKSCPALIANLRTEVTENAKSCSSKTQAIDTKYTGILNKTIALDKDVGSANAKIVDIEMKIFKHDADLAVIRDMSSNNNISLSNIRNDISRFKVDVDQQMKDQSNALTKKINDLTAESSKNDNKIEDHQQIGLNNLTRSDKLLPMLLNALIDELDGNTTMNKTLKDVTEIDDSNSTTTNHDLIIERLMMSIKSKLDKIDDLELRTMENEHVQSRSKYLNIALIFTVIIINFCNFLIIYCLWPKDDHEMESNVVRRKRNKGGSAHNPLYSEI